MVAASTRHCCCIQFLDMSIVQRVDVRLERVRAGVGISTTNMTYWTYMYGKTYICTAARLWLIYGPAIFYTTLAVVIGLCSSLVVAHLQEHVSTGANRFLQHMVLLRISSMLHALIQPSISQPYSRQATLRLSTIASPCANGNP